MIHIVHKRHQGGFPFALPKLTLQMMEQQSKLRFCSLYGSWTERRMKEAIRIPLREFAFQERSTYIVKDQLCGPNSIHPPAQVSLPLNLDFKHDSNNKIKAVISKEYIPKGIYFGPLTGKIYIRDNIPNHMDWKKFWRMQSFIGLYFIKDRTGQKENFTTLLM
ncbi:PR domain zinc finger protein 1-like [Crotalus tigris]|uniref:PR domain zinc finger protein 1-like n=1 Tax=Crotalus tigris TaxID=88082 RepID=UPI00192F8085|nr:PR domain zinc finger protein 1-like [Crotalus tigris]